MRVTMLPQIGGMRKKRYRGRDWADRSVYLGSNGWIESSDIQAFLLLFSIHGRDGASYCGNGADLGADGKRVGTGGGRDRESGDVLLATDVAFAVAFRFGTNCSPVRLSTSFCIALNAKSKKNVYIFSAKTSTACTNSGIVPPYLRIEG